MLRGISIGFTAPSTKFAGATISLECTRYFDGEQYVEVAWAMNVWQENGNWVNHPGCDSIQDDTDAMVSVLEPFYDGATLWNLDETNQQFTFWEMVVRTLPENLLD